MKQAVPPDFEPRPLDRGWRDRHIRWRAEGRIGWEKTQLLYEDGEPVFDRRGTPRMWSVHVEAASIPGRPTSRELARRKLKAEEAARIAEAARALRALVTPGLRPPAGKLFGVDVAGMVLIGPGGAIGASERMARTLAPLAAGGRHPVAMLISAGGWDGEAALHAALAGIGGKLAAVGLRICSRKTGLRVARAK